MKIPLARICRVCGAYQTKHLDHADRSATVRMLCESCNRVRELRPVGPDRPTADVPGGAA